MNRYTALTLILLLILASTARTDEDTPSALSGQVVDMAGNPVPNFVFLVASAAESLTPAELLLIPVFQDVPEFKEVVPEIPKIVKVQSDANGHFTVTDIPPGFIQLVAVPSKHKAAIEKAKEMEAPRLNEDMPPQWGHLVMTAVMPNKRITAVQLNDFTFFLPFNITGDLLDEKTLQFKFPPAQILENVKIKVQPLFELQIRIVSPSGTPIANAEVNLDIDVESPGGDGFGTDVFTDADGYFTYTIGQYGIYTITADYHGLSGGLLPFRLDEKNNVPKNLVIRMGGEPMLKQLKPQDDPEAIPIPVEEAPIREAQPKQELTDGVWIVNPENGHAYKKITCTDWHDAQRKAIEQDAHLVSINDQAEQIWVFVIFGEDNPLFWIGLNDVEEEGKWQWDSGEPVTFTYWGSSQTVQTPSTIMDAEKDYAVMGLHHGVWKATVSSVIVDIVAAAIEAGAPLEDINMWSIVRHAVIEKDGLISKIPNERGSNDENRK